VGVFAYEFADGQVLRELRPAEEVFAADSLASFSMVPVTNGHPPELLTAANTSRFSAGSIGEQVLQDGDHVKASLLVTDAKAVSDLEAGKTQLSCGYDCELEFTPGEWQGQHYDAVQRGIRGNHVAIVDQGRMGPSVGVRMDGDAVQVQTSPSPRHKETRTVPNLQKFDIAGVGYEVSDQVAQAIAKERTDAAEKLDAKAKEHTDLKAEHDKLQARHDAEKERADKAAADLKEATDPAKMSEAVAARVGLEVEARKHLDEETKLDGLTDRQVKELVIAKLAPDAKLDGKSDDYVQARFDAAMEVADEGNTALDDARRATTGEDGKPRPHHDAKALRAKMVKDNAERWQKPPEHAVTRSQGGN
jgi:hypothetical protein